nr:MAG TPA: hypothetical protein [Caudoviricetes sp.]
MDYIQSSQKRMGVQMYYLWKIMGWKVKKWTIKRQKISYLI